MPLLSKRVSTAIAAVAFCAAALPISLRAFAAKDKADKSASAPSEYDVPEGTPDELLAFIKAQQAAELGGATRLARMENLRRKCRAIVTAAERIINGTAGDEEVAAAAKAEFESLSLLERLGDEEAADKMKALSNQLKKDKRTAVVNLLALHALNQRAQKLDAKDTKAVDSFLADVKQYAAAEEPDALIATPARMAMVLLHRADRQDEAIGLGRTLAEKLSKSNKHDSLLAAWQVAGMTGQMLEMNGEEKQAGAFYRLIADGLAKDDSPDLRQAIEELEGFIRKFELIGRPMPITGKLVDGRTFDLSEFKGKVVLVDFWATWCKPCVEELPNVKEVYEKYHAHGFEVVGISLDTDLDTLKEFLRDEHIPWPILFEPNSETHPMATKYGVSAVPLPVLIDRQGKVVTLSARGERLGELVKKLINAKKAG